MKAQTSLITGLHMNIDLLLNKVILAQSTTKPVIEPVMTPMAPQAPAAPEMCPLDIDVTTLKITVLQEQYFLYLNWLETHHLGKDGFDINGRPFDDSVYKAIDKKKDEFIVELFARPVEEGLELVAM